MKKKSPKRRPLCPICKKNRISGNAKTCSYTCGFKLRSLNQPIGTKRNSRRHDPSGQVSESDERTVNTWRLSRRVNKPVRSLEDLVKVCRIDTKLWDIQRWLCNKWEVGTKDPSGNVTVTPLFQVKAWLRRKVEVITIRAEIDDLKRAAKRDIPRPRNTKRPKTSRENLLEISPADHHFGKLAWGIETGWDDYDTRIAMEIFEEAIQNILERTKGYQLGRICFVVGNDILHIDNRAGTTESGTAVDRDSRYQKIFRAAREAVRRQIERLREVAPIEVKVVTGNHDRNAAWHLGDSLEVAFERHKDVTVDNRPTPRKYLEWGRVMLMHTHGDKTKKRGQRLPQVMAAEQPDMFGRTRFREIHLGHFHEEKSQELHGVIVRVLPSLCPPDAWHSENEYVGNLRRSEAFVFNKQDGLIGTAVYTVPNSERG